MVDGLSKWVSTGLVGVVDGFGLVDGFLQTGKVGDALGGFHHRADEALGCLLNGFEGGVVGQCGGCLDSGLQLCADGGRHRARELFVRLGNHVLQFGLHFFVGEGVGLGEAEVIDGQPVACSVLGHETDFDFGADVGEGEAVFACGVDDELFGTGKDVGTFAACGGAFDHVLRTDLQAVLADGQFDYLCDAGTAHFVAGFNPFFHIDVAVFAGECGVALRLEAYVCPTGGSVLFERRVDNEVGAGDGIGFLLGVAPGLCHRTCCEADSKRQHEESAER